MAGKFPQLLDHVWLAKEESEAVMHALLPKLQKSRKEVESTLFEVIFYSSSWTPVLTGEGGGTRGGSGEEGGGGAVGYSYAQAVVLFYPKRSTGRDNGPRAKR